MQAKAYGMFRTRYKDKGIQAGPETVRTALRRPGYRTRGSRRIKSSGAGHPDRDARFPRIKRQTGKAVKDKNQVISADTKKKEVPGGCKNGGKERYKKGEGPAAADHDSAPPAAPRACPYGIYSRSTLQNKTTML
jgi:hypothetical protein